MSIRRRNWTAGVMEELKDQHEDPKPLPDGVLQISQERSAEEKLIRSRLDWIAAELPTLEPELREVLLLVLEGQDRDQISAALGITAGRATTCLRMAANRLRKAAPEQLVHPPEEARKVCQQPPQFTPVRPPLRPKGFDAAVDRLPATARYIVRSVYLGGTDVEEFAKTWRMSKAEAARRLQRALKLLEKELGRCSATQSSELALNRRCKPSAAAEPLATVLSPMG